ncbi:putative zinc ribbon protein [Serratia fonticola]|uniref:putative zinc ribbon protein n=1 Tax=Serratia fonticola TaxID=47917 RepID=UPI00370440A8
MKTSSDAQWFCTSCHCPLKLRNDVVGEEAWFVHNPDETTKELLAGCGYLNTEIKKQVFMQKLRSILSNMDKRGTIRYWYCVWCQSHYQGGESTVKSATRGYTA